MALSDLEVEHQRRKANSMVAYKFADGGDLRVMTTRPETILEIQP